MRTPLLVAAALGLACPPAARADDAADAKEIVAKAIKATGWQEGKSAVLTWKEKGTLHAAGMKFVYAGDWWVRPPDAMRFDLTVEFMGQKTKLAHAVNGDTVWEAADGQVRDVTGPKKEYAKGQAYQFWVQTLTPLTRDPEFKLATAGEKKVNEKPAVGVRVERAGKPTITLYFDKSTGLPVKSETRVKDEFQGWKEVLDETYYEDWKDVEGGGKVFTKLRVVRDGKLLIESDMSDFKRLDRLDPKLLEKP